MSLTGLSDSVIPPLIYHNRNLWQFGWQVVFLVTRRFMAKTTDEGDMEMRGKTISEAQEDLAALEDEVARAEEVPEDARSLSHRYVSNF